MKYSIAKLFQGFVKEIWSETPTNGHNTVQNGNSMLSIRENIVNAIIELVQSKKKPVTNGQILKYLENRQVKLGDSKNKAGMLSAIISQELKRPDCKLKRVDRGTYDIK